MKLQQSNILSGFLSETTDQRRPGMPGPPQGAVKGKVALHLGAGESTEGECVAYLKSWTSPRPSKF